MYNVLCVSLGDPIISLVFILALVAKIMRFSSPGLVVFGSEALGATYFQTASVLSLQIDGFSVLAGTVSETGAL